jgi:uncharacterized protein YecE (DUF72 family)
MAAAYVGTSGWMYDRWRDDFYAGLPRSRWLAHCGERFDALEINATHYRLQRRSTFERWTSEVPPGFRFALKAHRYLTHVRRLRAPEEPISRERERAQSLGDRLAAVLWQLPARFAFDEERMGRLECFLDALVSGWPVRHALELRHRSWYRADVAERLASHDVAVCVSHAADWPMWVETTTDFVYVRLHGRPHTYASEYGPTGLRPWLELVTCWKAEGRDVFVFFDNDVGGAAPRDAARLRAMLEPDRGPAR